MNDQFAPWVAQGLHIETSFLQDIDRFAEKRSFGNRNAQRALLGGVRERLFNLFERQGEARRRHVFLPQA